MAESCAFQGLGSQQSSIYAGDPGPIWLLPVLLSYTRCPQGPLDGGSDQLLPNLELAGNGHRIYFYNWSKAGGLTGVTLPPGDRVMSGVICFCHNRGKGAPGIKCVGPGVLLSPLQCPGRPHREPPGPNTASGLLPAPAILWLQSWMSWVVVSPPLYCVWGSRGPGIAPVCRKCLLPQSPCSPYGGGLPSVGRWGSGEVGHCPDSLSLLPQSSFLAPRVLTAPALYRGVS